MSRRELKLNLEHLEERLLLDAVGPGEIAQLTAGDTLYFVQGSVDPNNASDLGYQNQTIIIAQFSDPGNPAATAQFYDSTGSPILENGDKIGDIVFTGTTEQAELYIWTGEFQQGFGLGNLLQALQDRPDARVDAFQLTVPTGETGATATYNTGRLIVQANGEDEDWYKFTATEGETINVDSDGDFNVAIYRQYGTGPVTLMGYDSVYLPNDFDANPAQPSLDDVTIYLNVPGNNWNPYTLEVDRVKSTVALNPINPYVWTNQYFQTGGPVLSFLATAELTGDSVEDVIAVSSDGLIYVADGTDGSFIYSAIDPGGSTVFYSSPLLTDLGGVDATPELVVGGDNGALYIVDLAGATALIPPVDLGSSAAAGRPSAVDVNGDGTDEVIIATADGRVHAIDVTTGALVSTWWDGANAVTTADFNHDGNFDIAATNADADEISVFLGNGDGTFQDQVFYTTGRTPGMLRAADFNNDTFADLVVINEGDGNLGIFLNNGDGTFAAQVTNSNAGPSPTALWVGDFDNDNNQDIALTNQSTSPFVVDTIGILLGDGAGGFGPRNEFDAGNNPQAIVGVHLDGNTNIDLVVANRDDDEIMVFQGNGNGTFTQTFSYATGQDPQSIHFGDFNDDNNMDIVVANETDNNVSVFLGNGNGTLQAQRTFAVGTAPKAVIGADVNNDGLDDVVTSNSGSDNVSVLLSQGGTFAGQINYAVGQAPSSIDAAIFDNDPNIDLVIGNTIDDGLAVLLGVGGGAFTAPVMYQEAGANGFDTGNINGDAYIDVVVTDPEANEVHVYFGQADETFQHAAFYVTGDTPGKVALADLNNDSALDLIVLNTLDDNASIYLNDGSGNFIAAGTVDVGPDPTDLVLAQINGGSNIDLAVTNGSDGRVSFLAGNGNGTFQTRTTFLVGTDPVAIIADDFNDDGDMDLATANFGSDNVSILRGNGAGSFLAALNFDAGTAPTDLDSGDFYGDDFVHIAVTNSGSNNVSVLRSISNSGTFQTPVNYAVGTAPSSIVVGDLNSDGYDDVIATNETDNTVSVLLAQNDGTGQLQTQVTYASGMTPVDVGLAYVDGDDNLDVIAANAFDYGLSVLMANGGGSFSSVEVYQEGGTQGVASADFNGDGWLDAVVTNSESNELHVFLGSEDGSMTHDGFYTIGNGATKVRAAELTGDTNIDLVVVNSLDDTIGILEGNGDGSFQTMVTYAVGDNPADVLIDNFNGGEFDLAVSNYNDRNITILVNDNAGNFSVFGTESVGNGPQGLASGLFNNDIWVDLVVVNNLDNTVMILLGDGTGNFSLNSAAAVGARPVAVTAGDFNEDNDLDIVVANRNDNNASLLLGSGTGTLGVQQILVSGNAPLDVESADIDSDGHLDLVFTNGTDDTVSVLLGQGNGLFDARTTQSVGDQPTDIAIALLDNDGNPDILVANIEDDGLSVLRQIGGGQYGAPLNFAFLQSVRDVVIGDFDGDGNNDAAYVDSATSDAVVLWGDGLGSFTTTLPDPEFADAGDGTTPVAIASGYFNDDALLDLAVVYNGSNTVAVYLNGGSRNFGGATSVGVGNGPVDIAVANFAGDARPDFAVLNKTDGTVTIYQNVSNGLSYTLVKTLTVGSNPSGIVAVDLDGVDGVDIVVTNTGDDNVGVLRAREGVLEFYSMDTFAVSTNPGAAPVPIVTGDFNGDGIPDIAVGNQGVAENRVAVLIGLGNGKLQATPVQAFNVGTTPSGLATGDVDNDGDLDLLITHSGDNTVGVLTGFGNGTFGNFRAFSVGDTPGAVAFGLLDGDIYGDLVVANTNADGVDRLLAVGGGDFHPADTYLNAGAHDVLIADLNGDTFNDIVISNPDAGEIDVYFGSVDGTLTHDAFYAVGNTPTTMDVGDIDGDLDLDLVVLNTADNTVGILLNNGDGTFAAMSTVYVGQNPTDLALGHFSDDGAIDHLDLAVTNDLLIGTDTVSILLGDGAGSFSPPTTEAIGDAPTSVAAGDLDGDGLWDLAVTNFGDNTVGVLIASGGGGFGAMVATVVGNGPLDVAFGDFDASGDPDIVVVNGTDNTLTVLYDNGGNGVFGSVIQTIAVGAGVTRVATGDLEGDSDDDILVTNNTDQTLSIIRSDGAAQTFAARVDVNIEDGPIAVAVNHLDDDGNNDIAVVSDSDDALRVLFAVGDGTLDAQIPYMGAGAESVVLIDLNNDTILDIAAVNTDANEINIYIGAADGTFTHDAFYLTGNAPTDIAAGDLNGDTIPDLVVTNSGDDTASIFLNDGAGNFTFNGTVYVGDNPNALVLGLFDADANLDLAVVNDTNQVIDTISILIGDGTGGFGSRTTMNVGSQPRDIATADLDGDGKLDLVTANFLSDTVSVLTGNGDGTFDPQTQYDTGIGPVALGFGSVDSLNDSILDIVVSHESANSVGVLFGNGDATFQLIQTIGAGTTPGGVIVEDVDRDGDADIVVANSATAPNGDIGVIFSNGDQTFDAMVSFPAGYGPVALASGLVDGDTNLDVVVSNTTDDGLSVLLAVGTARFLDARFLNMGDGPFDTGAFIGGPIALAEMTGDTVDDIVVANNNGQVWVIDSTDGSSISGATAYYTATDQIDTGVAIGDLTGDGQMDLVFISDDGIVVALDGSTGGILWTYNTDTANANPIDAGATPVIDLFSDDTNPDVVVAITADRSGTTIGQLFGIDGVTGTDIWNFPYETGGAINSTPVVSDAFRADTTPDLIFGSDDGRVHAVEGRSGSVLDVWDVDLGSGVNSSPAATDLNGDGVPDIIIGDDAGRVWAINGATGTADQFTTAEDHPNETAKATDLTYNATNQTGLGAVTPAFELHGDHLALTPYEYFLFVLQPGDTMNLYNYSNLAAFELLTNQGVYVTDLTSNGSGTYTNSSNAAETLYMRIETTDTWTADIEVTPRDLDDMVQLVTDNNGNYVWWNNANEPWMNQYTPSGGGNPVNVFAPAGSGGAVVTGDVYFSTSCTGFGTFAIDGSLKGSVGVFGATLDVGETIHEIIVGYVNSTETIDSLPPGGSTGGVYLNGNLGRFWSYTTIGNLENSTVDPSGFGDFYAPASFYVGGYFLDLTASGTIYADIEVGGQSSLVDQSFNDDWEEYSTIGVQMDDRASAMFACSPTGTFTVSGETYDLSAGAPDPQDWYAFVVEPGKDVTVEMTIGSTGFWNGAWIYDPTGRLVAEVNENEPYTWTPDLPGIYYLNIGAADGDEATRVGTGATGTYSVTVTGTMEVDFGAAYAGSNLFGQADAAAEFGDDITNTSVSIGTNVVANAGAFTVGGNGLFADVYLTVTGDLGALYAPSVNSNDGDYMSLDIGGNAWLLETTNDDFVFNFIDIAGNLGQLTSAGNLGGSFLLPLGLSINIEGHAGSIIAQGDCTTNIRVANGGLDLLYVGGDYQAHLIGGPGADIGFVHVVGEIYDDHGLAINPIVVASGKTEVFTDDGGAILTIAPVTTDSNSTDVDGDGIPDGASLTYRYIMVYGDNGPVGAAITEIIATDSVAINVASGQTHLGWITFGTGIVDPITGIADSYVSVTSSDRLGEVDLGWIMAGPTGTYDVSYVLNNTFQGDILSVMCNNIESIYARGHIGITDRFASELGGILNPDTTTWAFPSLPTIFQSTTVYAGGVFASGTINRIRAWGSIGDVHATDIGLLRADEDGVAGGQEFNFRGMHKNAISWDGLAGTVYASNYIGYIDPGSGFYGGRGAEPIGGIFVGDALNGGVATLVPDPTTGIIPGTLNTLYAADAVIEGPIFASARIGTISGVRTVFHESRISVGGQATDWTWWSGSTWLTDATRLNNFTLTGAGSQFDRSWITTGVLNNFYMSSSTNGFTDSSIFSFGDQTTQEGVNAFTVLGGGVDCTNLGISSTPFGLSSTYAIESNERIGNVTVDGGDWRNAGISSIRSIGNVFIYDDIVSDGGLGTTFVAPLGISSIRAMNIVGTSNVYIGTSKLGILKVINNLTNQRTTVDGPLTVGIIGGELNGTLETIGPHGRIDYLSIGRGINNGNVLASNYIGTIQVLTGDVDGLIQAGGANQSNVAINALKVYNGDLLGDANGNAIQVIANPVTVRPGGGINYVYVNGNIWGDIEATSNYKAASQNATTANINTIMVVNGGLYGDVTIQKNNAADARDPGGTLNLLKVIHQGQTAIAGDINVDGHINTILSYGNVLGDISATDGLGYLRVASRLDGNVTIQGNIGQIYVFGDVNGAISTTANATTGEQGDVNTIAVIGGRVVAVGGPAIDLAGDLNSLKIVGYAGPFADVISGDIEVGGLLNSFIFNGGSFNGDLEAGAINVAKWLGTGLNGNVTTLGGGGTAGQLNYLYVTGDSTGNITVAGNAGSLYFVGGRLATGNAAMPVIDVNGNLTNLFVMSYRGANPTVIDGDVVVGGTLNKAYLRDGNFAGTLTAGAMNSVLYYTDNGIQEAVTTTLGGINYLSCLYGPVNATVFSQSNIGTLLAYQGITAPVTAVNGLSKLISYGAVTAPITVQNGNLSYMRVVNTGGNALTGNVNVQAGRLTNAALYGNVTSTITAQTGVGNYYQLGSFTGTMNVNAGNLDRMTVVNRSGTAIQGNINVTGNMSYLTAIGNVLDSTLTVSGLAAYTTVVGNFHDSNITANRLARVVVTNTIQDTNLSGDEIRATDAASSFVVSDTTGTAVVSAGNSPLNFGNTMVRVG